MTVLHRDATLDDCKFLLPRLRQSDLIESRRVYGEGNELLALTESVKRAEFARVMVEADEPFAMYGCNPGPEGRGVAWFIGTPHVARRARAVQLGARAAIQEGFALHHTLFNFVDAENATSIRWLRSLGFTIGELVPFGISRSPFHLFYQHRHVS